MSKNKIKKILGFKTTIHDNRVKKYILWLPLFKLVYKSDKIKLYTFGIHLLNIRKYIYSKNEKPVSNLLKEFQNYPENQSNIFDKTSLIELMVLFDSLKKFADSEHNNKIAIFGVLPPETTGIANYNNKLFANCKYFDIFTSFSSFQNYFFANSLKNITEKTNIFSLKIYNELKLSSRYRKKIFVLGNSNHNLPYLQAAISEADKKNSYLYIHESFLLNVILAYFDYKFEVMKKWISKCYPEYLSTFGKSKNWGDIYNYSLQMRVMGIRIIYELTGISNYIVNNFVAKKDIENEIHNPALNVIRFFHPVTDLRNTLPYDGFKDNGIYIGTWGYPNGLKCTDLVIDAINELNNKFKLNCKLVLAGYHVKEFYEKNLTEFQQRNVICFDSPSDEELFSLMKKAKLSIQLRPKSLGESSGIICQLFGMNKRIITNKNFLDPEFEKYCVTIELPVTVEKIVSAIMKAIDLPDPDYSSLISKYSFSELQKAISKI